MLEKTPKQTGKQEETFPTSNKKEKAAVARTSGTREVALSEMEAKPEYQTYIYRSYGGGYQGL